MPIPYHRGAVVQEKGQGGRPPRGGGRTYWHMYCHSMIQAAPHGEGGRTRPYRRPVSFSGPPPTGRGGGRGPDNDWPEHGRLGTPRSAGGRSARFWPVSAELGQSPRPGRAEAGGKRFVENRRRCSPRSGLPGPPPPLGLWASPNWPLFPCLSCACPDELFPQRDAAPAGGKAHRGPHPTALRGAGPGPPRIAPPQPGRRGGSSRAGRVEDRRRGFGFPEPPGLFAFGFVPDVISPRARGEGGNVPRFRRTDNRETPSPAIAPVLIVRADEATAHPGGTVNPDSEDSRRGTAP